MIYLFKMHKLFLPSVTIFFLFGLSVLSPILPLHDPYKVDLDSLKERPSLSHPFGTDNKGRDIFARVLYGGKISIGVAITAGIVSALIGFAVGLAAGYFGGRLDTALMSFTDFILSFPSLLLAIAISVVLPSGVHTIMIAIAAVSWTSFARLIRGHVMTMKEMSFVEAARAVGCSDARIILNHIAPVCFPVGLVMLGVKLGGFILTEATLSFLGLGAQPPSATWGSMVSANRAYILTAPWMVFFPGVAISITSYCFNVIGEALKERQELRERKS